MSFKYVISKLPTSEIHTYLLHLAGQKEHLCSISTVPFLSYQLKGGIAPFDEEQKMKNLQ